MDEGAPGPEPELDAEATPTELSRHRTGLSFHRTRMSADRTLMGEVRTSISLVTFGFTIFSTLAPLVEAGGFNPVPARRFGASLVILGTAILALGIAYHVVFMHSLRAEFRELEEAGMVKTPARFPVSLTLATAVAMLVLGLLAAFGIAGHTGPFR